ncbi:hypothetical protein R6Q57_025830 [Mikania cordata]
MNKAATVIFISDEVDGGFANAIIDGFQPGPSSYLEISKETFDLPLDRYGITDTKASGNVTNFVDAGGVKHVSIMVLKKYESPILACAISEVLLSVAGEDTATMPSLIFPFLVDSSKLKLERKKLLEKNIYGIQIGPQTDVLQALECRHVKAPSSMQIHHESLSFVLQLVRVLNASSFILIGQSGQNKNLLNDIEIIFEMGESLASATSMQFVKEKVTWNPIKVSKEPENEPWRSLYG